MSDKGYTVVCISMYDDDLEAADATVAELKRRGWTKANRSHLIRLALRNTNDLDAIIAKMKEVA